MQLSRIELQAGQDDSLNGVMDLREGQNVSRQGVKTR